MKDYTIKIKQSIMQDLKYACAVGEIELDDFYAFFTAMWNYMFLIGYDETEFLRDFPKAKYYWEKYKPYFQKQRDKFNKNNLVKEW